MAMPHKLIMQCRLMLAVRLLWEQATAGSLLR